MQSSLAVIHAARHLLPDFSAVLFCAMNTAFILILTFNGVAQQGIPRGAGASAKARPAAATEPETVAFQKQLALQRVFSIAERLSALQDVRVKAIDLKKKDL